MSFDSVGGSNVTSKSVNYGATTTAPTTPTKSNATFGGWYTDSNYTDEWIFASNTMPANNVTLYAKWSYVVDFDVDGGGPSWTGDYNRYYGQENGLFFELESKYLRNSFSPVHFNIAGNDF